MSHRKSPVLLSATLMLLFSPVLQARDILAPPETLPLEEEGQAWYQSESRISGTGTLKIRDAMSGHTEYKGFIRCDVRASAAALPENEVEFALENSGHEVEASSRSGTLTLRNCNIIHDDGTTTTLGTGKTVSGARMEVEIEDYSGSYYSGTFSEYEAKARDADGNRIKLELKNGTFGYPGGCIPPCGPGGGIGGVV